MLKRGADNHFPNEKRDLTAVAATTSYEYDDCGNIILTTVTGPDIAPRVATTGYDASKRFPVSTTNAKGHTASTVMDEVLGLPAESTDINGHVTRFFYDGFGRPTRVESPDGTVATTTYAWAGGGSPEGALFGVTTQTVGLPAATVWSDRLGRPISKEGVGWNGTPVHEDTLYDFQGRAYAASDNYFAGETPLWSVTEFDVLDRPVRHTGPDNSVTQSIYNGLSTTVLNAKNQSTTTVTNPLGQVVSITDSKGGLLEHFYDAIGSLSSTRGVDGSVTSFTYDSLGRKTAMSDPDMGAWSYEYYSTGELKRQTDAKGQQVSFTYDVLGRPLTKTEPEGQTI